MNFKGKQVTVFGAGVSGWALVNKLSQLGAAVFLTENQTLTKAEINCDFESGGHSEKAIQNADLIVLSPGVHPDLPVLEKAREKNIPIISEIELAFTLLSKPLIAITGTNGKTTTTTLIGEILKQAGLKTAVAGNIGFPLILVDDTNLDFIVVEVSSYQLEASQTFKPFVAVILNLSEDHLERHQTWAEYIRVKSLIFANQTAADYLIFNEEDAEVKKTVQTAKSQKIPFSLSAGSKIFQPSELKLKGAHNLQNALAAAAAAEICGVSPRVIRQTLASFSGLEHRLEKVAEINGITFINDSKSTNPDSTVVAIKAFIDQNLILILGGRDKGGDLTALSRLINQSVKSVILIGEAADRFEQALKTGGGAKICRADSLTSAVQQAFNLARSQDLILLSPACASFDMFQNYEERGKIFKQIVLDFKNRYALTA